MLAVLALLSMNAAFGQDAPAAPAAAAPAAPAAAESAQALIARLPQADYSDKREIVRQLAVKREPFVRPVLAALLEGQLQARDSDQKLFIVVEGRAGEPALVSDALTGQPLAGATTDGLTRIGTNNQLRRALRGAIAQFDLSSDDARVRLGAVQEILRSPDEEAMTLLRDRVGLEKNARVVAQIQAALALGDLSSEDASKRLTAVQSLRGSLNSDVFNRLTQLAATEGGDPDVNVRSAALAAVSTTQRWRTFYGLIETLFFGLSLGSVLVLAGIGLAVTFGVMGVINMAHGELMMLGAYTVYVIQLLMPQSRELSLMVAVPAAFIVSGLMGVLIERGIVRFLYGRPLETLLATFGVSLILQQVVRDVFSANNRPVETPQWMSGTLQINEVLSITYSRLYIIIFTLIVFALLLMTLKRTRLGLEVRAVSQNRSMARAMGIRTEWVDAMTFGLGSGIAGIAGVALSQLTNVGPNLGQSYIVDSFMVVVFGGVGSLWGTQIGGTTLGVVNKLLEPYAGAVLAKIFVLVALILFIQRKPRGLFPQKGRAAEG